LDPQGPDFQASIPTSGSTEEDAATASAVGSLRQLPGARKALLLMLMVCRCASAGAACPGSGALGRPPADGGSSSCSTNATMLFAAMLDVSTRAAAGRQAAGSFRCFLLGSTKDFHPACVRPFGPSASRAGPAGHELSISPPPKCDRRRDGRDVPMDGRLHAAANDTM
jgi:hypothetical protein